MIIANNKMFQLLIETKVKKIKLPYKLQKIINDGVVRKNNCVFLDCFFSANPHIKKEDFLDNTGYENFINGFHIDDYCKNNYLENALLFVDRFIEMWNNQVGKVSFEIIISQTEQGYHFSAHSFRKKEIWIDTNEIDKFNDPIFVLRG